MTIVVWEGLQVKEKLKNRNLLRPIFMINLKLLFKN